MRVAPASLPRCLVALGHVIPAPTHVSLSLLAILHAGSALVPSETLLQYMSMSLLTSSQLATQRLASSRTFARITLLTVSIATLLSVTPLILRRGPMASLSYLLSLICPGRHAPQQSNFQPTTKLPKPNDRAPTGADPTDQSADLNITVSSDYLTQGSGIPGPSASSASLTSLGRPIELPQRAYVSPRYGQAGHHASSAFQSRRQLYRAPSSDDISRVPPPRRESGDSTTSTSSDSSGEPHPQNMQNILDGREVIISHSGWARFSNGSQFAAVLVALNYGRAIIMKERDGIRGEALLADMMVQKTTEDVVSICSVWKEEEQLQVDEIHKTPYFRDFMALRKLHYGQPGVGFASMLHELKSTNPDRVSIAVITSPLETIVCIKVPTSHGDIFVVFDPLTKPEHPSGSGLIFNNSLDSTSTRLSAIFAVDGPELPYDWQSEVPGSYSAHIFSAQETEDDPLTANPILKELSASLLKLQDSLAETTAQSESLKLEKRRLEAALEVERRIVADVKHEAKEVEDAQKLRIEDLLSQNRDLLEQVESHGLDIQAHLDRIKLLEREHQNTISLNERKKAESEDAIRLQSEHIDSLEKKVDALTKEMDRRQRKREEKLAERTKKIKELEEEVQRTLAESQEANRIAEEKVATQKTEIDQFTQEVSQLKEDKRQQTCKYEELISSHAEQLSSLGVQQEAIAVARDAAQDMAAKQAQKLRELERELARAQQDLATVTRHKDSLESAKQNISEELKQSQDEVLRLKSLHEKEARQWQTEQIDLVEQIKRWQQRVKELEETERQRIGDAEEYQRRIDSLNGENRRLQATVDDQARAIEAQAESPEPESAPPPSQSRLKKRESTTSLRLLRKDALTSRTSLFTKSADKAQSKINDEAVPPVPPLNENLKSSSFLSRFGKGRRQVTTG